MVDEVENTHGSVMPYLQFVVSQVYLKTSASSKIEIARLSFEVSKITQSRGT